MKSQHYHYHYCKVCGSQWACGDPECRDPYHVNCCKDVTDKVKGTNDDGRKRTNEQGSEVVE